MALNALARLQFEIGVYAEALRLFERLAALQPEDASVLTSLGAVQVQLGRTEDAITVLDQALAIDPTPTTAQHNRQEALRRLAEEQSASR